MNKVNFNAFQNIHASEEQLARVLAIPETAEKAPAALPWYRQTKMIAAAASIVLVTVMGFTVYFLFGNKNPIPIAENPTVTVTDSPTEYASDGTQSSEMPTAPASSDGADGRQNASSAPTQPATQITTDSRGNIVIITTTTTTRTTRDATEASIGATEAPTNVPHQADSTDAPRPTPTQKPVKNPTIAPTQRQTEKPSDSPHYDPTDPSMEIEPTDEPLDPNVGSYTEAPTDAVLTFSTTVKITELPYRHKLYCRIYDRNKKIVLGDPDRYAESHRAEYTLSGNQLTVTYRPSEHGINVPPGEYAISFHDENGSLLMGYHTTVN